MTRISSFLSIIAIFIAIYWKMDACPSLYIAEMYLSYINPSLLSRTFHDDTVTLITGASDGLGAEMAKQLCTKTSTKLILMARRKEKLEEVKQACLSSTATKEGNSGRIALIEGDVTKGAEAQTNWIKKALEELGKTEVDVAVVNAGRGYSSIIANTEERLIRDIMELNFIGAVSTVKAVLSTYSNSTLSTKGTFRQKYMIAISSVAGKLPLANAAGYAASKAAMSAFFDALRAEYSYINMRVTTVCPGPTESNIHINSARENGIKDYHETKDMKKNLMPVERAIRLTLAGSVVYPSWLFHDLWFAFQPILTYVYIAQYIPDLAKFVGKPVAGCSGSVICEQQKKNN